MNESLFIDNSIMDDPDPDTIGNETSLNDNGEDLNFNDKNVHLDNALFLDNDQKFDGDLIHHENIQSETYNDAVLIDKELKELHNVDSEDHPNTIDISEIKDSAVTFKGHSQSEINRHVAEAKHDIAEAESNIRHHTSIANSKARMGEPHSYEDSRIKANERLLNEAKEKLYKWQHTKADPS